MRLPLLGFVVLIAAGDRSSDREALLAADRSLSDKTAARGMVQGFLPSMTDGAAFLQKPFRILDVLAIMREAFVLARNDSEN